MSCHEEVVLDASAAVWDPAAAGRLVDNAATTTLFVDFTAASPLCCI